MNSPIRTGSGPRGQRTLAAERGADHETRGGAGPGGRAVWPAGHGGGGAGRAGGEGPGQGPGHLCDGGAVWPCPAGEGGVRPVGPGGGGAAAGAAGGAEGGRLCAGGGAGQPGHHPGLHRAGGLPPHPGHPALAGAAAGAVCRFPPGGGAGPRGAGHHGDGERRDGEGGVRRPAPRQGRRGGCPGLPGGGAAVQHGAADRCGHRPRLRGGQPAGCPGPGEPGDARWRPSGCPR